MNPKLKLGLYALTVVGILVFGALFAGSWRRMESDAQAPAPASTNAVATATNEPAAELTPEREAVPSTAQVGRGGRGIGRVILWGLFGTIAIIGLGFLIAHDVSQFAGDRATGALFDHDGDDLPESLEDQVEKAHGNGDFLDAIRLLREFLKENPRGANAQIRIAEIYEKDLHNPLAAALEYEEVLKLGLSGERRGWAAIHLVNLYNRLDKPELALAWLQRIVQECPDTPAAAKARERLGAAGFEVPEPPATKPSAQEPPSNLPPGFRPRGS